LCHRVDLHNALKEKATTSEGDGTPVQIHLRHKVAKCDLAKPSLTIENGDEYQGDLVIGADGVHVSLRCSLDITDFTDSMSVVCSAC
jgi:2-polyprenyl-6-methoxyphenol hydroxylase-like FAD-dependent oxidoreductase